MSETKKRKKTSKHICTSPRKTRKKKVDLSTSLNDRKSIFLTGKNFRTRFQEERVIKLTNKKKKKHNEFLNLLTKALPIARKVIAKGDSLSNKF